MIITDKLISSGETTMKQTTNIEGPLNIKAEMILVPDIKEVTGAIGTSGSPVEVSIETTLTIITATGNMSAHAYYNLENGTYNGQVKKICLHPSYDSTKSVNYTYEIDIDINKFCDPDGNVLSDATLILNKGGQTLNMVWVTDGIDGHWILLDSNLDFYD
jgi:hypothetical protein